MTYCRTRRGSSRAIHEIASSVYSEEQCEAGSEKQPKEAEAPGSGHRQVDRF